MSENKEILPDVSNIKTSETYTLPSKGLLYAETENIPASITLRRMTTKEDKIRMRNASDEQIKKDILDACITTEGVDAGKLKLNDANYLLFRLRSISLLIDTYKVQCNCRHCGSEFIHELQLSDVPVKYYKKTDLKKLKIELPVSKAKVDLKYPSLNDMILYTNKLKAYIEQFPNADKNEAIYSVSAMMYIDKINGSKLLSEELEDLVDNLDIIDNRILRRAIDQLDEDFGLIAVDEIGKKQFWDQNLQKRKRASRKK